MTTDGVELLLKENVPRYYRAKMAPVGLFGDQTAARHYAQHSVQTSSAQSYRKANDLHSGSTTSLFFLLKNR